MLVLYIALIVIFLSLCAWIYLVAPGRNAACVRPYLAHRYAHRGLHDERRAENSRAAFAAAVEAGYGIELDTRLSADGVVVVCHDATLTRVCGVDRRVKDMTAAELAALDLCQTGEGIPTLAEVLALVDGRVPILVEIKEDTAADTDVSVATLAQLADYRGPYIIEGFNPLTLGRVKKIMPKVPRGLLCSHFTKEHGLRTPMYRVLQLFLLNFIARPQFLAYDGGSRRYLPFRIFSAVFRIPLFAWTVTSQEEEDALRRDGFDTVIFEGYTPREDKP